MKTTKFNELNLSSDIQQALVDMGFEESTQIQAETIPQLLSGRDIIGQAQTGTGKTAAFGIPLLEQIDADVQGVQAIILCPTRELAIQVSVEIKKLAKYKRGIFILPVYGGESIANQIKDLKRGVQIVVGTPGRVIDHLERKTLSLKNVRMVVLDEADEMLNMGFREDIEAILQRVPEERQTALFSATMPKAILNIAKEYQKDPFLVKVTTEKLTAASIEQVFYQTQVSAKPRLISVLMDIFDLKLAVVFCNMKVRVDELTETLKAEGHRVEGIHGDLSQAQRNKVLTGFRKGTTNILVATDVAARGIDVSDVDAVFNYDIPLDPEYYVHRIGRTGRAGKSGLAFSFVTGRNEMSRLRDIEDYAKVRIEKRDLPSVKDYMAINRSKVLKQITGVLEKGNLDAFETLAQDMYAEGLTSEQLAVALLKMTMGNAMKEMPVEVKQERSFERRPEKKFGKKSDFSGKRRDSDRGGSSSRSSERSENRSSERSGSRSSSDRSRGSSDRSSSRSSDRSSSRRPESGGGTTKDRFYNTDGDWKKGKRKKNSASTWSVS